MWAIMFPRDCTALPRRRKMFHFRAAETQKAAKSGCPFRILGFFESSLEDEKDQERSLKGLGKDIRRDI